MTRIDFYGSSYIFTYKYNNFLPFPPFTGPVDIHFGTKKAKNQHFSQKMTIFGLFRPEMEVYRSGEGWEWMEILIFVFKNVTPTIKNDSGHF